MPLLPPLVLEAGSGTKFQLFPLFNIVGPFLGLTRNLRAHHDVSVVKIVTKCFPFVSVMYILISFTMD
jgi:hypothetical protein